jgi:hypothetical protein
MSDLLTAASEIITFGEKAWDIINAGKAVSGFESKSVNAIPKTADLFADLDGWRGPNWLKHRHTTVVEGKTVIDHVSSDIWLQIHWSPFGRYKTGKNKGRGCYLSNVRVTYDGSSKLGSNVKMSVQFGDAVVHGTTNPIAGLDVWVVFDEDPRWADNATHTTYGWHIKGDGSARRIS